MADLTDIAHERDDDGDLLPVTETVEIHGDEFDVDIYPATTGQRNEWLRRLEGAGEDLDDELTDDLLDEFVADYEPADFGVDAWSDVRPAIVDNVTDAVMARLFDAGDSDEFRATLNEASPPGGEGN